MIFKNNKITADWKKAALPLILFSLGLVLSASDKTDKIDSACKTVISQSVPTDSDSKDVNPNGSSPNSAAIWMVAAELGQFSVKQSKERDDKSTGLERICQTKQEFNFTKSENTLGQIHSELGRQFTLLGEKPSGTS